MLTPMPVLLEMIHSIHCQTNTYILMLQATTAIYKKKLFLLFYPSATLSKIGFVFICVSTTRKSGCADSSMR